MSSLDPLFRDDACPPLDLRNGQLTSSKQMLKRGGRKKIEKYFDLYGSAKSGLSDALVGERGFWNLRCSPRLCSHLGNVQPQSLDLLLIIDVNGRVSTFLFIYSAGGSFGRYRRPPQIGFDDESLVSRDRRFACFSGLVPAAKSLHFASLRVSDRSRVRL
jgi:hypothetical protein